MNDMLLTWMSIRRIPFFLPRQVTPFIEKTLSPIGAKVMICKFPSTVYTGFEKILSHISGKVNQSCLASRMSNGDFIAGRSGDKPGIRREPVSRDNG